MTRYTRTTTSPSEIVNDEARDCHPPRKRYAIHGQAPSPCTYTSTIVMARYSLDHSGSTNCLGARNSPGHVPALNVMLQHSIVFSFSTWGGGGGGCGGGGSLSTNQLYGDGTVQPPTVQCRRCPHGPPGTTTAVTSTYMSHLHDRFDGGGHEMGGRVYNGVRKRRDVVVTRLLLCGDHVLHHVRAVRLGAVPPVHRRHAVQVATVHGVTRGDTVGVIGLHPGDRQHRVNDPPTGATRTRDDDTQRAGQLDRNAHCTGNNTVHAARRPAFAAHAPWSRPHGARARTSRSCPGQSMFACLQPRRPLTRGCHPDRHTDRR